jgi:hypothetical protein
MVPDSHNLDRAYLMLVAARALTSFNLLLWIGPRNDVEIYVDGSRCMVDGIWYKPNDPVVVLDAAIGKYNAKYVTLEADWVSWCLLVKEGSF